MMSEIIIIDAADRISQLPIDVIHKILRPLDVRGAARTSVLSKTWRQIWNSRPFLEFDLSFFSYETRGSDVEKFKNHVDDSLKALISQNLNVEEFTLKVPFYKYMLELDSHIDRWLDLALKADVKVLKVLVSNVHRDKAYEYRIPTAVLAAKTITSLCIDSCRLGISSESSIQLFLLRKLCLNSIRDVGDDQILCLIKQCPLIEDLRLIWCDGMEILRIFGLPDLRRVVVKNCGGFKKIQIEAPKLNTFTYSAAIKRAPGNTIYHEDATPCEIIVDDCMNLQFLRLETSCMTEKIFQRLFSKFPQLQVLFLGRCHMLTSIKIVSPRLRRLTIDRCKDLKEVEIEAPKLTSLTYDGDKIPFSSIDPSSLRQANLAIRTPNLPDDKLNTDHLDSICGFLRKLSDSGNWLLIVQSNKNILIYEDIREVLLPKVRDVCLYITRSPIFFRKVLKLTGPKSISVLPNFKSHLLRKEVVLQSGSHTPNCCLYLKRKFKPYWLKEMVMIDKCSVFEDKDASNWFAWLNSQALLNQTISCLCKWR